MKKFFALLVAGMLTVSLVACGGDTTTSGDTTTPDTTESTDTTKDTETTEPTATVDAKVGVFYYAYSDVFMSTVRTAVDAALTDAGVEFNNYDANNTQATQNEQIDTALSEGYNILVVNLVTSGSSDAAETIRAKAEAAGAQVIFFNRPIEEEGNEGAVLNKDGVCFIGTDAPEAGHLQGKMIGEYLLANYDAVDLNGDGVIQYAMFKGDEANLEAIARTQYGVEDANLVLTEAGKPELAYFDESNASKYQVDMGGAWSAAAALEYMTTNLSQYNEANGNMIELIICNNDNMAEGCISALEQAGYNTGDGATTIPVFGVDATDAAVALIGQGKMTGTVKQDAEGMAQAVRETVVSLAGGNAPADAMASIDAASDLFSVDPGLANKLYVAYSAYTGE